MSKDLHLHPTNSAEEKDRQGITDPRRSKELVNNQAVRFFVNAQVEAVEDAIMRSVTDAFAAQSESMRQMTEAAENAGRAIADLQERLMFLELRWWERLMRYLEWDYLSFRIWLNKRLGVALPKSLEEEDPEWKENQESLEDVKGVIDDMVKGHILPTEAANIIGVDSKGDFVTMSDVEDDSEAGFEKKCLCGHTQYVHASEDESVCTVEGCDCEYYEPMTI